MNEDTLMLLLTDRDGRKEEEGKNCDFYSIKAGNIIIKKQSNNSYHLYIYPDVQVLNVQDEEDVSILSQTDFLYLLPVLPTSKRLQEARNTKRMEELKSIQKGDTIMVLLEHDEPLIVTGLVRYKGEISSHKGMFFGIEIKDHLGKGNSDGSPHFHCGFRNAAYVSMDKILQKTRFPGQIPSQPMTNIESVPAAPRQTTFSGFLNSFSQASNWFTRSTDVSSDNKLTVSERQKSHSLPRNSPIVVPSFVSVSPPITVEKEKEDESKKEEDIFQYDESLKNETHLKVIQEKEDKEETKQDTTNYLISINKNIKICHTDVVLYHDDKIGTGGWADVIRGKFCEEKVAVKIMHQVIISEHNLKLIFEEINIMAQLRHPYLLQFIGAVFDHPSGNPLIITEEMDTSLRRAYKDKQLTSDQQPVILSIMRDVAVGLNYLHTLPDPIIHRDVSSANVLLESKGIAKWKAKLGDFGSAKVVQREAITPTPGGPMVYAPPEAYQTFTSHKRHIKQTTKFDVFSYGILLCEVLTCTFPETPEMYDGMIKLVGEEYSKMIEMCTEDIATDRPTIKDVIRWIDKL